MADTCWDLVMSIVIPDERTANNVADPDVADLVPSRRPWNVGKFMYLKMILRDVDLPLPYLEGSSLDLGLPHEIANWTPDRRVAHRDDPCYFTSSHRAMIPDPEHERAWRLQFFISSPEIDFMNYPSPEAAALGATALMRDLCALGWEILEGPTFTEIEEYADWCREHFTIEEEVQRLRSELDRAPEGLMDA